MTLLSVNVNKIAVLRNSRGGLLPDVCSAAETCIQAGAGGITVHPRPDLRHVRPADVASLADLCRGRVEFNIEGNVFAPARAAYPGLLALVEQARPTQCTLVPDSDAQLTSDHGFNLRADAARLRGLIAELNALGCRVSIFVDADASGIERAAELGASRVEIYTGPYAMAFESGDYQAQLDACVDCARRATNAGLGVNAGHDLNQANLPTFHAAIPNLAEVSIGHALIGEALFAGLAPTVRAYLAILATRE
ncbi:MAG TPA: pyridoxine 5'-phosphate synthase [Rudaea sp.]|nr:pyridoxine 5'-phosphate synthase [Rudaea sp.]